MNKINKKISTDKVIFNFTDSCNMDCPYCYIPFRKTKITKFKTIEVMKRICELNPTKITIGGGDPLMYSFLEDLVKIAYNETKNVHIDTNGYGYLKDKKNLEKILPYVSLLGLPLDGHNNTIHTNMRNDNKHFDIIIGMLNDLKHYKVNIKINTVLSKKNYTHISKLAELISSFNIFQWSIFQFWELEKGKNNKDDYLIDSELFNKTIDSLKEEYPLLPIKASSVNDRKSDYLFVTQNGDTYTVMPNNHTEYIFIGSIFDDKVLEIWSKYN